MTEKPVVEETQQELLRQQVFATRLCAVFLLCFLVAMLFFGVRIYGAFSIITRDISNVSQTLSQIDMQQFNQAVSQLEGQLQALDMDKLNETIEVMNGAAQKMQESGESMKKFADGLAGLFG